MIRLGTSDDRFQAVTLWRDAHAATGMPDTANKDYGGFNFKFDAAYVEKLFLHHIAHQDAVCLVHDVDGIPRGLLMATAFEHPFGPVWMAKETFWWIDPAYRGTAAFRLLDAYEGWAKAHGCAFVGMSTKANPTVAKLYERRGYKVLETHYLRSL